jgi:RimJ/RimL family protein N-acetyltransferase
MIVLHPWTSDDLWLLHATLGNPDMMQHLGGVESVEKIEQRHARFVCENDMFTIRYGDAVAGSIGFWETTWHGDKAYETGWMMLPKYAGRGFATRAALQIISLARNEGKHRFLHAFPNVENAASNAVCRKAGFTNMGEHTSEYPKGHWMQCNDWRVDLFANR